jgi:riboflavin biosynthesis pyrimidine reductase
VWSARSEIERDFDPDVIQQLKGTATRDISVGGPRLAGQAIKMGLVDECHHRLANRHAAGQWHNGRVGRRFENTIIG